MSKGVKATVTGLVASFTQSSRLWFFNLNVFKVGGLVSTFYKGSLEVVGNSSTELPTVTSFFSVNPFKISAGFNLGLKGSFLKIEKGFIEAKAGSNSVIKTPQDTFKLGEIKVIVNAYPVLKGLCFKFTKGASILKTNGLFEIKGLSSAFELGNITNICEGYPELRGLSLHIKKGFEGFCTHSKASLKGLLCDVLVAVKEVKAHALSGCLGNTLKISQGTFKAFGNSNYEEASKGVGFDLGNVSVLVKSHIDVTVYVQGLEAKINFKEPSVTSTAIFSFGKRRK